VAAFLLAIGSGLLLTSNTRPAPNLAAARFFDWGLPAFLIVTGALGLEPILKEWRLPMLLGDASYSIYLTHSAALAMLKTIVLLLGASGGLVVTATFVIAGCIMSVLAGIVVFHAVEKPLVARCKVLAMSLRRTPLVAAGRIF
jgi:exopolysaccharide production protein ExoZ